MRSIWILVFISLCISCKQDRLPIDYQPYHKTIKLRELVDVDDYMQELYSDYYADPTDQKQLDQNLIIEYLTNNQITASRTESGLYYKVFKYGNSVFYRFGQKFSARYTGYFLDGKVFDSNLKDETPLIKNVGEMIPGWNEGTTMVSRRAKVSFYIPSHLAYGKSGVDGIIAPNTVLIFDVELSAE